MGDWGNLGSRPDFGHPDVLYLKKNEKQKVRLLDHELPVTIFYHSCRDESGTFLKIRCVGSRNGCRFCEINNREEYVKANNSDRPFPFRSEFAKAVYVYELSQMKLLVGKQVWEKGVKPLGMTYGTLVNRDLDVHRQDISGQTSYTVVPLDVTPFGVTVDPTKFPRVEAYLGWLDANAEKIAATKLKAFGMGAAPAPAPAPAGTYGTPQTQQPAPAAQPPVQPPVQPAAPAGNEEERKALQAEFSRVMTKKFDPRVVEKLVTQHGQGKQVDEMTVPQLQALIADYKKETNVQ